MTQKYKSSNGLTVLGLGLFGGMVLGWIASPRWMDRATSSTKSELDQQRSLATIAKPNQKSFQVDTREPAKKEAKSSEPNDLTSIEGIGPKINEVLQNAGITTFAQLASAEVER
jgi:predicted flap endonuclease-1-like 5' DNA nuclease